VDARRAGVRGGLRRQARDAATLVAEMTRLSSRPSETRAGSITTKRAISLCLWLWIPGSRAVARVPDDAMTSPVLENDLAAAIRSIPDYPKPGIVFRDITTLLGNARAFRRAVDELVQPWAGAKIDKVAGIEARGFIIGGAVAHQVSA